MIVSQERAFLNAQARLEKDPPLRGAGGEFWGAD